MSEPTKELLPIVEEMREHVRKIDDPYSSDPATITRWADRVSAYLATTAEPPAHPADCDCEECEPMDGGPVTLPSEKPDYCETDDTARWLREEDRMAAALLPKCLECNGTGKAIPSGLPCGFCTSAALPSEMEERIAMIQAIQQTANKNSPAWVMGETIDWLLSTIRTLRTEVDGLRRDNDRFYARLDRAWIDGAKCGWNLGVDDNRTEFNRVIKDRQKAIRDAALNAGEQEGRKG